MDHPELSPAEQEHVENGGNFNYAGEEGAGNITYVCSSPGTEKVFILSHFGTERIPSVFPNKDVKRLQDHPNLGARVVYNVLNGEVPEGVGVSWNWKSELSVRILNSRPKEAPQNIPIVTLSQKDRGDEGEQSVYTHTNFTRVGNGDWFVCTTVGDDKYKEKCMKESDIIQKFGPSALPSGDKNYSDMIKRLRCSQPTVPALTAGAGTTQEQSSASSSRPPL
nr:hypothetical protein L204_03513 [Cryptococcus depauperatus CBS 7855]